MRAKGKRYERCFKEHCIDIGEENGASVLAKEILSRNSSMRRAKTGYVVSIDVIWWATKTRQQRNESRNVGSDDGCDSFEIGKMKTTPHPTAFAKFALCGLVTSEILFRDCVKNSFCF